MLLLIFLSSGLFLGWSLGANDAANIFGSAVGSKMIHFRKAAIIASIFVVLGAVFQGRGTADTLSSLGAVDALAGGFTVSLCAALTVFWMTRYAIPVSTSQAIVGAIIGWSMFAGLPTNYTVLTKIVSTWISGPILGMIFAAGLFLLLRWFLRRTKIHVIKLDSYIRISLIVVGAFGAYSLGANNIANVMGVFINTAPDIILNFGFFSLDGVQLLFLLGGLAIALGIFTYSERVMHTVGNGILSLSPEAAIVVVLSQALVLFIFSSSALSGFIMSVGLPAIPLVPVSSTQVVVGSVVGIGLVKGAREIKSKALGEIAAGWVVTPLAAGFLTYIALFFVQNVFKLPVFSGTISKPALQLNTGATPSGFATEINMILPAILAMSALAIIILIFLIFRQQKLRLKTENELLQQQNNYYQAQKTLSGMEVTAVHLENSLLNQKLETKRREYINIALNISSQREFLQSVAAKVEEIKEIEDRNHQQELLNELSLVVKQKMNFSNETEELYAKIELIHKDFRQKLTVSFPALTEQEKRLAVLLRLNFSSKEIASLMGISPKSAEIARYRLRKKLNLKQGESLTQFIHNL
ncbi:MAG: inorganic phosphate transporter [Lentimicrobium sp.]|jgi:phosphate/sulfate permease/DNA-directed RNA polymerase specialized sigma24 family protein